MPIILDGQEKYYPNVGPSLYEQYIAQHPQTEKPTYADSYSGQLGDLYNKITNRNPFSYDASKDPLYQAYKDQYIQGGKLAMKDTMGQAAALTGGYGNTYGQQVGQQAYDAYLQNLGEVIPQLYNMAYQQYQDQGDALTKQYAMLGDLRDQEYNRYRDTLGDWENERAYATQLEAEDYRRRTAAENTAYSRQQDAYANLYAAIKSSGYVPSDYELQAAGMTRAAADAIAAEYQRGVSMDERTMALKEWSTYNSGGGGSGGGGGGGSGGGGGYYYAEPEPQQTNWTFVDVAGVYDKAKAAGDAKAANKVLNTAVKKNIITKDEKKYIIKDNQVKDRL